MYRPPRIETTFKPRDEQRPVSLMTLHSTSLPQTLSIVPQKDPSHWVDDDLLSYVHSQYPASDSYPLRELIRTHRLTPPALWYLQSDHDALTRSVPITLLSCLVPPSILDSHTST